LALIELIRDCYHCNVGHPEYIKANYDTVHTAHRHRAHVCCWKLMHSALSLITQAFIYVKNADGSFSRQTDPAVANRDEIEQVHTFDITHMGFVQTLTHECVVQYMEEKTKEWQQMGLNTLCSPASSFPGAGASHTSAERPERKPC
jgi:hypothetical protein